MAKQQIIQSAKFKRDYVAASAVVIFFLIVAAEIALAVSIPSYLHRENAMALQVRRLTLLKTFDGLRSQARDTAGKNDAAVMELRLMNWNLNLLANYLRENAEFLTDQELADLQKFVNQSGHIVGLIAAGKNHCREYALDTAPFVDRFVESVQKK